MTEEVWSWWQEGSVHHSAWPKATELGSSAAASGAMMSTVAAALTGLRGAKSQAKASMRAELSRVELTGTPEMLAAVRLAEGDLRKAGKITGELVLTEDAGATELRVDATLAETV